MMQKFAPDGTFIATPRLRYVAYNVKFDFALVSAHVDAALPASRRAALDASDKLGRVAPTDYNWDEILKDFLELAAAGNLEAHFGSWAKRNTQSKFEGILLGRMAETKASVSTIRRKAKELMKADTAARSASTSGEPS